MLSCGRAIVNKMEQLQQEMGIVLDPGKMMEVTGEPLEDIAAEAKKRLSAMLERLP